MSQSLYVCALDLSVLQRAQGSKDRRTLLRVVRTRQAAIDEYDAYFAGRTPTPSPLAAVIEEIVMGHLASTTPRWQYESAVATIADALGTPLEVVVLRETKPAFSREVDRLVAALRRRSKAPSSQFPSIGQILTRGPLLRVPVSRRLRLGSGYLTADEARIIRTISERYEIGEAMTHMRLTWPDLSRDAVFEYLSWIRSATVSRRGLFLHR